MKLQALKVKTKRLMFQKRKEKKHTVTSILPEKHLVIPATVHQRTYLDQDHVRHSVGGRCTVLEFRVSVL